jgi:hypothetical protein
LPSLNCYAHNPLAAEGRWGPFSFVTAASLPQGTMVALPGCLIVSTSDVSSSAEQSRAVSAPSTQKLTYWHLPLDMREALGELLSTLPLGRA